MIFFHFLIFVFTLFHSMNCNHFYSDFLGPKSNIQSNQYNEYPQDLQENEYQQEIQDLKSIYDLNSNYNSQSIEYSQQENNINIYANYDLQENNTNDIYNLQAQNQSLNIILLKSLASYELGTYGDNKCEADKFPFGGIIGGAMNGNWETIGWGIKDFATGILGLAADAFLPGSGTVVNLVSGLIQPGDPNAKCLEQIDRKLDEGFRNIEAAIQKSTREILHAIEDLGQQVVLEIIKSEYITQVRSEIIDYDEKIKRFLRVSEIKSDRTDFINKCETADNGQIKELVHNFELYLSTECSEDNCLPKKMYDYLHQKYDRGSIDDRIKGDLEFLRKRKQFMQIITLDAGRLQYAAYMCSLVVEKTPKGQKGYFKDLHEKINKTLDHVQRVVMKDEVNNLAEFTKNMKNHVKNGYKAMLEKTAQLSPVWIKNADDMESNSLRWFCNDNGHYTCIFVESTAEYRVINCPKSSCMFLPNTFGMHIIFLSNRVLEDVSYDKSNITNVLIEAEAGKQQILNEDKDSNFDGIIGKFKKHYPHNKEGRGSFLNTVFFYKQGPTIDTFIIPNQYSAPKYNKVYTNYKESVLEITSM